MRRSDRLFQIIQRLRTARKPITAQQLAAEFELSVRTLYRDLEELQNQRVPIRGTPGQGYILEAGYDLPPLMLTADEIEVAVLGAQWASRRGDPALARSARQFLAKIREVVPAELKDWLTMTTVFAVTPREVPPDPIDLAKVREWIRCQRKLRIRYQRADGKSSERLILPLCLAYFDSVRILVAWCQWRQDFRHFRTDRIQEIDFLEARSERPTIELLNAWRSQESQKGHQIEPLL